MNQDRPSTTAMLIAAATIAAARDRRLASIVAPGAARWSARFLRATAVGRGLARIAGSPLGPAAARLIEWSTIPGIVAHFQARKHHIEQQVRRAAREGFGRLIVLGAGLDTLATRLASEPEGPFLRLLEADHPATQKPKAAVLARAGLPREVRLVPLDLGSSSVAAALVSATVAPGVDTVVVAEGLLMYLPEDAVRRLLSGLAALPCGRVRLVFTFMERVDGKVTYRPQGRLVGWWLTRFGEPFLWGASDDEATALLESTGWRLREIAGTRSLKQRAGMEPGRLRGESVAVADRVGTPAPHGK